MTIRWLRPDEFPQANEEIQQHGWAPLNEQTSRILGAFDGDVLVEVVVLQLYPVLGPLVRLDARYRDNGDTTRALADEIVEYLEANGARGYLAFMQKETSADFVERLCKRCGLERVTKPVYAKQGLL